ncbi:4Fe-4S ferredoxin [Gordonibacter sp. An230]|uniref:4Fe-4S binding protein n=1 Tax=Gordonibacter sp. An230 TaxID=1965592 RepID=UPI000B38DAA4|nr:4Fe-4S binding protein [Gordonibacter sp. An230]OUO89520.1 4Fe-4S ferredoxin [Gordonibacter sp. An230]
MKASKVRVVVAAIVFVVLCAGLIAGMQLGTLSGFGWDAVAALCPLGAITTMIASQTFVPRAIISLIVMAVLVFFVGRAFCGWICPVPLLERVRGFFRSPKKRREHERARRDEVLAIAREEMGLEALSSDAAAGDAAAGEKACARGCGSCGGCEEMRAKLDSRHYVLGGALLSTAVFGFPVFCLVCPIGLSFATVLLVWRLFSAGDMTWSVVLAPAVLVVELVFLRKWCTRFCPLAGLMNLVSRFGRMWRPVIDDAACLETATGSPCSRCAEVCDADINLRHPGFGERTLADCTRCRACVDACPANAISMPFIARKGMGSASTAVGVADGIAAVSAGVAGGGVLGADEVATATTAGGARTVGGEEGPAAGVGVISPAGAGGGDVQSAPLFADGGDGAPAASADDARLDGGGEGAAR